MKYWLWLLFLCASPLLRAEPDIRVQALFTDKILLQVNGESRLLSAGDTTPEGITLIRADSLDALLEYQGVQRTYALDERIGGNTDDAPRFIQISADQNGMYFTEGDINGSSTRLLVDTGATTVAINALTASQLGLNYNTDKHIIVATASGTTKAYPLILDNVKVGPIELANIKAVVIDGLFPQHVLLGMTFLSRLQVEHSGQILELRLE
jgi:aspartyl protease family protein